MFVRDVSTYHLPYFRFIRERLLSGKLPSWNPYTEFGEPLAALGLASTFYPAQFLMMLDPDPLRAYNLVIVFHVALAGCFMYWCAREFKCSRAGSFVAGAAYALGPEIISMTVEANILFGAAWMPAVLAAFRRILRSADERASLILPHLLLIISFAMILLAGAFQVAVMTVLILLGVGVIHTVRGKPTGLPGNGYNRKRAAVVSAAALLAAILFGCLIAAAQVFPIWELFSHSIRAAGYKAHGYTYGTRYAFEWLRLPEVLFPSPFGPVMPSEGYELNAIYPKTLNVLPYIFTIYLGAGVLAFALAGIIRRRTPTTWLLAGFAVFGVLAGLGANLPPLSWIIKSLPFFRSFRYAEKWFCMTALVVPLLAAFGFDAISAEIMKWKNAAPKWLRRLFFVLAIAAILSAVLSLAGLTTVDGAASLRLTKLCRSIAHSFAVLAVISGLLIRFGGRVFSDKRLLFLLFVVIAADLAITARMQTFTMPRKLYKYEPALAGRIRENAIDPERPGWTFIRKHGPKTMPPVEIDGRAVGMGEKDMWSTNRQMVGAAPLIGRLPTIQRHLILTPTPVARMLRYIHRNPDKARPLLDRYGIEFVLETSPPPGGKKAFGFELVSDIRTAGQSLWRNPDRLPMAYLSRGTRVSKSDDEAINLLTESEQNLPADVAVITEKVAGAGLGPAPVGKQPGEVKLVAFDYDRVAYDVDANYETCLIENALNYPGWLAKVDGKSVRLDTANGFLRAVRVPAGKHRVELSFQNTCLIAGAWISALAFAGWIIITVLALFLWRRAS